MCLSNMGGISFCNMKCTFPAQRAKVHLQKLVCLPGTAGGEWFDGLANQEKDEEEVFGLNVKSEI